MYGYTPVVQSLLGPRVDLGKRYGADSLEGDSRDLYTGGGGGGGGGEYMCFAFLDSRVSPSLSAPLTRLVPSSPLFKARLHVSPLCGWAGQTAVVRAFLGDPRVNPGENDEVRILKKGFC